MTYNGGRGLTDAEAIEIAVRHLMTDTEHWGYVTEAEARAAIDRMRDRERRFGPEAARDRIWADNLPEPRRPADPTAPPVAAA